MEREIINIDEQKCTGCGLCVPGCPEGALQIIDGKARLVSDLFCDGLGACIGACPEGAITVERREAEPYDEAKVMKNIIAAGANTIRAHLSHLQAHGQVEFFNQALAILKEQHIDISLQGDDSRHEHVGCPGSRSLSLAKAAVKSSSSQRQPSQLSHWPIQMHLISPAAAHYRRADVLLAADCVAFSLGDFHSTYLNGKTLAIACPKLDEGQKIYSAKLKALIEDAHINTLTVMMMQVPCCGGLLQLAQSALSQATRKIPIKAIVVSLEGEILREERL